MRRAAAIGVTMLAIAAAAGCGDGPGAATVPSLTGFGPRAAAERLCDLGLTPFTRVSAAYAGRDPAALATAWLARPGTALGSVPPAGTKVPAGMSVLVQLEGQAVGPIFVSLSSAC
jgi:PASTA domain-containing protein